MVDPSEIAAVGAPTLSCPFPFFGTEIVPTLVPFISTVSDVPAARPVERTSTCNLLLPLER